MTYRVSFRIVLVLMIPISFLAILPGPLSSLRWAGLCSAAGRLGRGCPSRVWVCMHLRVLQKVHVRLDFLYPICCFLGLQTEGPGSRVSPINSEPEQPSPALHRIVLLRLPGKVIGPKHQQDLPSEHCWAVHRYLQSCIRCTAASLTGEFCHELKGRWTLPVGWDGDSGFEEFGFGLKSPNQSKLPVCGCWAACNLYLLELLRLVLAFFGA